MYIVWEKKSFGNDNFSLAGTNNKTPKYGWTVSTQSSQISQLSQACSQSGSQPARQAVGRRITPSEKFDLKQSGVKKASWFFSTHNSQFTHNFWDAVFAATEIVAYNLQHAAALVGAFPCLPIFNSNLTLNLLSAEQKKNPAQNPYDLDVLQLLIRP